MERKIKWDMECVLKVTFKTHSFVLSCVLYIFTNLFFVFVI